MLDSGAYSAWTRGGSEINLDAYIAFVKYNAPHVDHYISLDVIPGRSGQRERSPEAVEHAAQQSYRNHRAMKDAGLASIPVFHQDERFEWLDRMIADGERYIAISPSLRARRREVNRWLKKCFARISPDVRTHGLGVTSAPLIEDFPWASVDSATWVMSSAYGRLIVPRRSSDGRWDFSLLPIHIAVTDRLVAKGGTHIENTDRLERVHQWLDEIGVRLTRVRVDQYARYFANLRYFKRLEEATRVPIFHATHPGNLDKRGALSRAGIKHRLVTYFDFQDQPEDALQLCLNEMNQWRSDRYTTKRKLAIHCRNVDYEGRDHDDYS
jgi:hypothetical protein